MQKSFLLALFSVILFGCVKPDPPKVFVPEFWSWSGTGAMSAEINGNKWECDTPGVVYSEAAGWKSVSGNADNINIAITSTDFSVDGIYPLRAGSANSAAVYVPVSGEVHSTSIGSSGECKILANTPTYIQGMFYFKTTGPISGTVIDVKKGVFYAKKP